jgi:hypothetical protein
MADAKLNPKKFGLALGILCGAGMLIIAWLSAATGLWGDGIALIAKFYLHYAATPLGGIIGLIWGFIDGFVGGYIFAWLYNWLK